MELAKMKATGLGDRAVSAISIAYIDIRRAVNARKLDINKAMTIIALFSLLAKSALRRGIPYYRPIDRLAAHSKMARLSDEIAHQNQWR